MDAKTAQVILLANGAIKAESQAIYEKIRRASTLELACRTDVDAYEVSKAPDARKRFIKASKQ